MICICEFVRLATYDKNKKQVDIRFSWCVKYVPAKFCVDPYIEVKGQTEVKVMWHVWTHLVVILTKISHDLSMYVAVVANILQFNNVDHTWNDGYGAHGTIIRFSLT